MVFRRPLVPADTANRIPFAVGTAIPIAFFAWDGDNGEDGRRGAVSSWYFLYLDGSLPPSVFVAPVLAVMLAAGLGVLVVIRAQRREKEREPGSV